MLRFNFYAYERPFMHCLYVICGRNFYSPTHIKITQLWKSTLRVFKMAATVYETNNFARGGGGVLNKFLFGEAPPRGSTPYPFVYHFFTKKVPLSHTFCLKWYPFHVPCLELCIPFKAVKKCTVF